MASDVALVCLGMSSVDGTRSGKRVEVGGGPNAPVDHGAPCCRWTGPVVVELCGDRDVGVGLVAL